MVVAIIGGQVGNDPALGMTIIMRSEYEILYIVCQ